MKCRICNLDVDINIKEPILRLKRNINVPEINVINFYFCDNCKNIFADEQIDKKFHIKRYSNRRKWNKCGIPGSESRREAVRNAAKKHKNRQKPVNERICQLMTEILNKENKYSWLEVGCGSGDLQISLKEMGLKWDLLSTDIDPDIIFIWDEKNINAQAVAYEKEKFEENSKDIISIHRTFDHFNSPYETLQNVKYHLKPGGHITALDMVYDFEKEQKRNKFHHTLYFTEEGYRNMFEMNGFVIEKIHDITDVYPVLLHTSYEKTLFLIAKSK